MPFTTRLELIAEFDDCPNSEKQIHTGDEFGIREEEHELIRDFLMTLHFSKDWFADKINFEETRLLCPSCKRKRGAAAKHTTYTRLPNVARSVGFYERI